MRVGGTPSPRGEPLLLCSASPRRADLLRAAGIAFEVGAAPDIDETPRTGATVAEAVREIALMKVSAAMLRFPGRVVLCADTVVSIDGAILGKPVDREDAVRMLRRLSGREHEVLTFVAMAAGENRVAGGLVRATVSFRALAEPEIAAYVATGEPMDKAGAYAIQGGAAGFVVRVVGETDTVVGLPIRLVRRMLPGFFGGGRTADEDEGGAAPPS